MSAALAITTRDLPPRGLRQTPRSTLAARRGFRGLRAGREDRKRFPAMPRNIHVEPLHAAKIMIPRIATSQARATHPGYIAKGKVLDCEVVLALLESEIWLASFGTLRPRGAEPPWEGRPRSSGAYRPAARGTSSRPA